MLAYTYTGPAGSACWKSQSLFCWTRGCDRAGKPGQHLHQRSAHQARQRAWAVPGVTVGHELVGVVKQAGAAVTAVAPATGSP